MSSTRCIRWFDMGLSCMGLIILSPVMLLILIIGFFDTGSPIFVQERVGRNKKPFNLYKFRSMRKGAVQVPPHLLKSAPITKFGEILRKTKLDEIPQLLNVLKGEMSFVGPRPSLFNQVELIAERERRGVLKVLPGITGLAQINEIDSSNPQRNAMVDAMMLKNLCLKNYFIYIFSTALGRGMGDRVPESTVRTSSKKEQSSRDTSSDCPQRKKKPSPHEEIHL